MTQIGNVYASGLFELAQEEHLEKEILQELKQLQGIFEENPEFMKLLSSYELSKQERCSILDQCLRGKIQRYLLNFMKILVEKGYIRHFPDCCRAYEAQYNEANGILPVQAVSAVALTEDQKLRLQKKLIGLTGKTIILQCLVDPRCLGGVRLNYDGRQVDGTVQNRLDSISKLLQNTVL